MTAALCLLCDQVCMQCCWLDTSSLQALLLTSAAWRAGEYNLRLGIMKELRPEMVATHQARPF